MDHLKLCAALVEQAPDAIIFADPKGVIRLWNAGAEVVFGYPTSEALGQSLDLIVPVALRKAHWSAYESAMRIGHTKYGRRVMTTRSVHKSGERIYVNLSFTIVRDGEGTPVGALAQARDFTARYLEEKALLKKVTELERKLGHAGEST